MTQETVLHPTEIKSVPRVLEAELHLPGRFLEDLRLEDDWSFVIKTHALVEAAVSHQLSQELLDTKLMPVFRQLPLGERNFGKLKFARELGLLSKGYCQFISGLSILRNRIAHNVEEIQFTFKGWLEQMEKNQRSEIFKRFDCFVESKEDKQSWRLIWERQPKEVFWAGTLMVLSQVAATSAKARRRKQEAGLATSKADYLDRYVLSEDTDDVPE